MPRMKAAGARSPECGFRTTAAGRRNVRNNANVPPSSSPRAVCVRVAIGLGLTLSLIALDGCGFKLRGWDLETSVASVHVAARPRIALATPLRRALRQAGVQVEPRPAGAAMTVELLEERRGRRTVAVTGSARAAEYEVSISIRFAIRAGARVLREPQWLEASRVFAVDRDNIAGTAGEQSLIEAELTNDLTQQIMRALNAAAADLAPPAAPDAS